MVTGTVEPLTPTVQDHADHYPCDSGDLNNVTVASSRPVSVSLIEIKKLYGGVYGVYGVTGARDRVKVWSSTTQQVTPVTDTDPEFRSHTDKQLLWIMCDSNLWITETYGQSKSGKKATGRHC